MIHYENMHPKSKQNVDEAWLKVAEGLEVYAFETALDAEELKDTMNDRLWDQIQLMREEKDGER